MMLLTPLIRSDDCPFQHAKAEEYTAFVQEYYIVTSWFVDTAGL